ncbi:MAG: Cysteine desulfurase [Burkholderia plantarii]|nr:MAG: Cysteine desulfurase [Burkholderia plantarii]
MTTPTPIADLAAPGATAPVGLPDPATLSALANAFFATLPGQSATLPALAVAANPAPGGSPVAGPGGTGTGVPYQGVPAGKVPGTNLLPSAPTQVLTLGNRGPALAPHAASGNGLPDTAAIVAPTLEPRSGGSALGVAPVAAPVSAPAAARGAPAQAQAQAQSQLAAGSASPFYFLGDAAHGWHVPPQPLVAPSAAAASAESFGLPGEASWRDLLPLTGGRGAAPGAPASAASGSRYFIDEPHSLDTERRFAPAHPPFDVNAIRRDFPILQERVNGKPLVWFDNAATTHKPQAVIDRIAYFYAHENSNIHRAAHALAGRATDAYEHARDTVRRFIGAASPDEIVFVRGTTEAINLIAKTWGVQNVGAGDEIIVSNLEHHANIVPWQQLAAQTGAVLRVIPVDDSGQVLLDEYRKLLNSRTKIVSVTQVSNALGTVVPVKEIVDLAHRAGALALVDGAQSISHLRVDVQALDADFFVFSGHKIYGPTGIGVVYGKRALLDAMPPWQGGGNMIADVTFERTVFQPPPNRFEAGTGNIADAVGLGAALDYVSRVGIELIARYEHDLLAYATERLGPVPGVRLVGTARDKASVLSFVLKGYETEEVGRALNEEGIAVRSGHHCAQPILCRFGLEATVRPSLAFYNTCDEVDLLVDVVRRLSSRR